MREYRFMNNRGEFKTVLANDEAEARVKCMIAFYGTKPDEAWLGPKWIGRGLHLRDVK